jgi:hypothetical protein
MELPSSLEYQKIMGMQMTNCNAGIEIPCKLMNDGLHC